MEGTWTHRSFDLNRTAMLHRDRSSIGRSRPFIYLSFIGRRRPIVEELRDRAAIAARSSRDRGAIARLWTRNHLYMSRRRSAKTSDHDRSPIVTRSWLDRGMIVVLNSWEEEPNSPLKLVKSAAELKPRLHAQGIAPTTLENRPHDRLYSPRFRANFPFKNSCTPFFCSSTFDRLVKKLSEFRGRS